MRSLLRVHWPLLMVLAIAATVRVAVAIAYKPAIFFGDSWAYLDLAYGGNPVGLAPDRPSGYPLLIDLLSIFGRSLGAITTAQHLAGLLTGVLVYALLLRLRLPRWLATAGAAVVLLDAYAMALEQQILAEAFFTLALAASFFLVVGRDRGAVALAASGGVARSGRDDAHRGAVRRTGMGGVRGVGTPAPTPDRSRRAGSAGAAARLRELARRGHGPLRPHAGRWLVPVRAHRRDRRLWQRGRPGGRTTTVRPQRARPARGCGVPHLERRRPRPPHVRGHELGPRSRRPARTMRCAALPGRSSATGRAATRSWSGTTSCATSPRERMRAGTPTSRSRCRSSAGSCAATRSRGIGGSPASSRTCSRPPSACATTTSACTSRGR